MGYMCGPSATSDGFRHFQNRRQMRMTAAQHTHAEEGQLQVQQSWCKKHIRYGRLSLGVCAPPGKCVLKKPTWCALSASCSTISSPIDSTVSSRALNWKPTRFFMPCGAHTQQQQQAQQHQWPALPCRQQLNDANAVRVCSGKLCSGESGHLLYKPWGVQLFSTSKTCHLHQVSSF